MLVFPNRVSRSKGMRQIRTSKAVGFASLSCGTISVLSSVLLLPWL